MRISSTEEYGLRCIVSVARNFDDDPVTAQEVADSEGISVSYAQKLLRLLAQAGLIESRRGVGGGYVLARHPGRISVGDVVRALDADFDTDGLCARHTGELDVCAHSDGCNIRPVWSFIEEFVTATLDGITVDVLVRGETAVSTHLRRLSKTSADETPYCPVAEIAGMGGSQEGRQG